ncbi:MAG: hypothetical protein GX297_09470, partial [Treponema sp.]|nr:hypothetical protein [Treponema sp.]
MSDFIGNIYSVLIHKTMIYFADMLYNYSDSEEGVPIMEYKNVNQTAVSWGISERSVRNYCATGKVPGALLDGKTWKIPANAEKPMRKQRSGKLPDDLLERLKLEKESSLSGGIYHKVQIDLTYNSNHIEGSKLSYDQTRYIFETNTIGIEKDNLKVDDIVET